MSATRERSLTLAERELTATVLPMLTGRVFHVTSGEAYIRIAKHGSIRLNDQRDLPISFEFSNLSYFRCRACVSVCDLREKTDEEVREGLCKYNFIRPREDWLVVAYLVLGESARERLVTWADAVCEAGATIQGVPHIEAGHPGPVSVDELEEVLIVDVKPDPWLSELRKASGRS